MRKLLGSLICLALTNSVFAASSCKSYSYLQPTFKFSEAQNCLASIKTCTIKNNMPDQACVSKIAAQNPSCKQVQQLANTLEANLSSLTITPVDQFYIVRQDFIADGQQTYYILSPVACLINTNIDARQFSRSLALAYRGKNWMSVNSGAPKVAKDKKGLTVFTVRLKVTDSCLACPILGWAYVNFVFDAKGTLIKRTVVSFNKS